MQRSGVILHSSSVLFQPSHTTHPSQSYSSQNAFVSLSNFPLFRYCNRFCSFTFVQCLNCNALIHYLYKLVVCFFQNICLWFFALVWIVVIYLHNLFVFSIIFWVFIFSLTCSYLLGSHFCFSIDDLLDCCCWFLCRFWNQVRLFFGWVPVVFFAFCVLWGGLAFVAAASLIKCCNLPLFLALLSYLLRLVPVRVVLFLMVYKFDCFYICIFYMLW
jgi:hypothetical protein